MTVCLCPLRSQGIYLEIEAVSEAAGSRQHSGIDWSSWSATVVRQVEVEAE